jgi:hypothetical protein
MAQKLFIYFSPTTKIVLNKSSYSRRKEIKTLILIDTTFIEQKIYKRLNNILIGDVFIIYSNKIN